MILHEAWSALRHGGNLLSPAALEALPEPGRAPWGLADRLRTALLDLGANSPGSGALGPALDVVLEEACGLTDGWAKGSALGATDAEKLLDGTVLKPRRRWTAPTGEALLVFTTDAARLGVGRGRRPAARVIEYLRRRRTPLALLTNGAQWRLIWADADSMAWAEWEAERWLEADRLSDELLLLRRVLSPAALARVDAELSPLLVGIRDTRRGQAKLSKELGERVRRSVETLLRSRAPLVGPAWGSHESSDLYVAACQFVMRVVVTLFAEARELLPTDNPVYHQAYGLRGLLDQLDRLTPERRRARHMAWPRLLALFRLLHNGSPHPALTLPAYGGDLFRAGNPAGDGVERALALLESLEGPPDDDLVHRILVLLTRTTQRVREGAGARRVAAPVDFTELTSEYIGILYEGLLDYELHRADAEPVIFLNLGDQPALPLDRLEQMDDKTLRALVEKASVRQQTPIGDDADDETENGEEEEATDIDELDDSDSGEDEESEDPELEESTIDEADAPDDVRAAARARATAWGRRAAEVGKLVRRPRGRSADAVAAYEAQLDAAAEQLVADLKLPGELYLVRWGGTRKGAGTFYTRPQLTLPTVRRTLEPLLHGTGDEAQEGGGLRTPEEILSLTVCDPAMGSGSFLVAALRVLTGAMVESLHRHERIERRNGRTTIHCALIPEADRTLPTEGFEERLEAIVRRAVVEHCLYGVDLDPLAVELARVALWVETLDRNLPFTFLDHKLRCGDSLVGTWLDRFRDYPLLCFDRTSPDEKYRGVNHPGGVWQKALKERRKEAIRQQAEILAGQLTLDGAITTDAELRAAVEKVRALYRDLQAVPAGRPDERARIWRERIQADAAIGRVREAFDTWCALWFWPLDELDALPMPRELHAPSDAARAVARRVADQRRFFHWELEFPDVFTAEGAGFDAVIGNPPWETLQPQSKEFFTNHDPLYRAYGKQEALGVQKKLFAARPALENEWLMYVGFFKDVSNWLKNAGEPFGDGRVSDHEGSHVSLVRGNRGTLLHREWKQRRAGYHGLSDPAHPFRHQGSGKAYTYKMFVEVGHALLRGGGQLGFIVPSGLYTDKGTGALRKLLLHHSRWRWIYGFENRNKLFDIDSRFKFCVVLAEKGGETRAIRAAFMRHELEDWAEARGALDYPAERVTAFSPKSLSILEIRTARDLEVLTRIYANSVLLGDEGSDGWGIRYAQGDFNMTSDSKLFIARDRAEADGFRPDLYGRWVNEEGEVLLPLYQGLMFYDLSPNHAEFLEGAGHSARWSSVDNPIEPIRPQFFMPRREYEESEKGAGATKIGFRALSNATNERTFVACLLDDFPCGNSVGLLTLANASLGQQAAITGSVSSFAFDWSIRQRIGGTNINAFFVFETGIPKSLLRSTGRLIMSLCMPGIPYAELWSRTELWKTQRHRSWQSCWALTPHERLRLRCMLDAIVGALYGLDRDDFAWILKDCDHPVSKLTDNAFRRRLDPKGFWRVDRDRDPELRHTVLSLAAFDDLQREIAHAGDRDAGIENFCARNDGEGWMLPETLTISELGLPRDVDAGEYDERARTPQPVRARMGERFLEWQLARSPDESWAECERHAEVLREGRSADPATRSYQAEKYAPAATPQTSLFGE